MVWSPLGSFEIIESLPELTRLVYQRAQLHQLPKDVRSVTVARRTSLTNDFLLRSSSDEVTEASYITSSYYLTDGPILHDLICNQLDVESFELQTPTLELQEHALYEAVMDFQEPTHVVRTASFPEEWVALNFADLTIYENNVGQALVARRRLKGARSAF